jgi:hypothetical protein
MSFRDTPVYGTVTLITAAFAGASAAGIPWLDSAQHALLAAGTIIIGIPHGATDNHVFHHVLPRGRALPFYAGYLLIAAAYGGLWALAPGRPWCCFCSSRYTISDSRTSSTPQFPKMRG